MEFLLLIYENEKRFASGFNPAEMQEYEAFGQQHGSAIKGGNALQPTPEAQTVRLRNGKPLTTDGPFAETKEQLGGRATPTRGFTHRMAAGFYRMGLRIGTRSKRSFHARPKPSQQCAFSASCGVADEFLRSTAL